MKAAASRYRLHPRSPGVNPRPGALVQVEFGKDLIGYADCHPWPELGDLFLPDQLLDLKRQLESQPDGFIQAMKAISDEPISNEFFAQLELKLHSNLVSLERPHSLAARTLVIAFVDGVARAKNMPLIPSLPLIPNHYSYPFALNGADESAQADELYFAKNLGFDRIKFKISAAQDVIEAVNLHQKAVELGFKVRWDCNQHLNPNDVALFLASLKENDENLTGLDWIEDPCPYDPAVYIDLKKRFGVRIAVDFATSLSEIEAGTADVFVLKPARLAMETGRLANEKGLELCVTSALDHPLGQLWAHRAAQSLSTKASLTAAGTASHFAYEPTPYSERLGLLGTSLTPAAGTGLGLNDLLETENWIPI